MTGTNRHASLLATAARLGGDAPASTLTVVETTARPGEMPPLHAHEADEAYYVVAGSLTIYTGEVLVRLATGDSFVVPSGVAHTHVADAQGARFRTSTFVASPARYAEFLRAVAPPEIRGAATADGAGALAAIAAANRIDLLGPPGALPDRARANEA
jgi:quercetin dioxygenase-like cupin family protein